MTNTRDIVQGMYDAAANGDLAGFFDALADDVVAVEPLFLPYGGTWRAKSGLQEMFAQAAAVLDVSTLKPAYVVVDGDRAFAVLTVDRREGQGTLVLAEESLIRDGKVSELRIYVHHDAGLATSTADKP